MVDNGRELDMSWMMEFELLDKYCVQKNEKFN
jgi:hypothetical protein